MINKYSCINIYENKKKNSKLSSQILYGEKFTILRRYKDWYKIKTSYDKYVGFIKKNHILMVFFNLEPNTKFIIEL